MTAIMRFQGDDGALRFGGPDGAVDLSTGGEWEVVSPMTLPSDGVGLGALEIASPRDTPIRVRSFRYRSEPASWLDRVREGIDLSVPGLSIVAAGGAIPASDRRAEISRRTVLVGAAALVGLTGRARAQTQYPIAEMEIGTGSGVSRAANPQGATIRLTDRANNVLPSDSEYDVLREGDVIGSFGPESHSLSIPPGRVGRLEIKPPELDSGYQWPSLGEEPVEYDVSLSRPPTEYDTGDTITLTAETALVEPVAAAGGDDTVVTIGEESIAHADEDDDPAGEWQVAGGELRYTVGEEPPAATTATVTANASTMTEITDDTARWIDR